MAVPEALFHNNQWHKARNFPISTSNFHSNKEALITIIAINCFYQRLKRELQIYYLYPRIFSRTKKIRGVHYYEVCFVTIHALTSNCQ